MAHYHLVTRLDPSKDIAWIRQGFKKHRDRWFKPDDLAAKKLESDRQKRAGLEWKPRLEKLRKALDSPVESRRLKAERELYQITEPRAVPSIMKTLAAGTEKTQLVAVELLVQIEGPAASFCLAMLAIEKPSPAVRERAPSHLTVKPRPCPRRPNDRAAPAQAPMAAVHHEIRYSITLAPAIIAGMRIVERRCNNRQTSTLRSGRVHAQMILCVAAWLASTARAESPKFDKDVAPILRAHCLKCHGGDTRKGGLDLRTVTSMTHGGDTGAALVPGKSGESLPLIEQVASKSNAAPARTQSSPMLKIMVLRAWIDEGARGENIASATASNAGATFWAFRPPTSPQIPAGRNVLQAANPIDRFLLAPAPATGGELLIRGTPAPSWCDDLYFDLWGLPPSPEQVHAYLADTRPDAWQRLIDSLLASPHYGERWGRHWLDLANYAGSEGILDADYERSAAWRYRDYVIRAFNDDTPYDRFLELQIAGDEVIELPDRAAAPKKALAPEEVDALIATGYLRCASDTSRPDFKMIKNAPGYYYQTLEDTVKILASSTMGLTLQCAKCHSHKYDPITQEEYYRVQAIFMSGYRPAEWVPQVERKLNESTAAQDAQAKAHNAQIDAQVAQLGAKDQSLKATFAARLLSDGLAKLPEPIRKDTRRRHRDQRRRRFDGRNTSRTSSRQFSAPPAARLPAILASNYPDFKTQSAATAAAIAALQARKTTFPEIRAFYDLAGDPKTPILKRGDFTQPGREVDPGVLQAIAAPRPFAWSRPAKDAKTSGRRLAFAKWLTQPDHPLTARVIVNRIWLLHFGEGIVSTP